MPGPQPSPPTAAPYGARPPLPAAIAGRELAPWGNRVGAYLLDGLITGVLIWIGVILIIADQTGIGVLLYLLGLAAAFVYYPLTMSRGGANNGQTIGKQLLGVRAVRDNGQQFNFGTALLREFVVKYLLFIAIGSWFLGIPWLLDLLWPLWDDQNRALHDMIVSSHVVRA